MSKRFLEEKISPGPGSYLALENWDKLYDTNINKKYKKIELKEKNENEGPDIYSYNSSFINSIEYNNYVKSNINYIKPPFGSSEERMIIKANSTTNMLSPCSYNFNDYEMIQDYNGFMIGDHDDLETVALKKYQAVHELVRDIESKKVLKRM